MRKFLKKLLFLFLFSITIIGTNTFSSNCGCSETYGKYCLYAWQCGWTEDGVQWRRCFYDSCNFEQLQ